MTLTNLQDGILRDKQRMTFNSMAYELKTDWSGASNWYPTRSSAEINAALSGLVCEGLADVSSTGGTTTLTLTEKGRKLACLMLS